MTDVPKAIHVLEQNDYYGLYFPVPYTFFGSSVFMLWNVVFFVEELMYLTTLLTV